MLDPLLEPLGYRFEMNETGTSSGGNFAVGRYENGERVIELQVRHELGIVRYVLGETAVTHQHLTACLGGEAAYPGFSDDPVDAFRHLLDDLQGPLNGVVSGTDDDRLRECAERVDNDPDSFKRGLP